MTNRQDRAPGRGIRRAGPAAGVLATVGIALGAWGGIAPASGTGEPRPEPASVISVEPRDRSATPPADGATRPGGPTPARSTPNRSTVDGFGVVGPKTAGAPVPGKPRVVVPGRAGVVTTGKPYVDRDSRPAAPSVAGGDLSPEARATAGAYGRLGHASRHLPRTAPTAPRVAW
ncbi:hypothetical protein OG948_27875 [Embleya sp. NBC_00888]|uniref:hypothetical protein n=1 Tax=Embleya sp. NBC_00888 TaxID=2975960 RepID=UPI00386C0213|nr:hypothetical protein OG948_27875 [Embleya sp. NBC_00888]